MSSRYRWPRRSLSLLLCLGAAVAAVAQERPGGAPEQSAPGPKLQVEKLSKSCYAVTQPGGRSNAGFVVGENGVLVVDCLESRAHGEALRREIRRVTKKPIGYVVLTHWHYDHSVGNQAFAKGVPVLAAPEAARRLAKRLKADRLLLNSASGMHGSLDISKVRRASREVDGQRSIDLGGVVVQLSVAGDCHSSGDLVVVVPAEKVLFAGDLVWNGLHPNISDGSTFAWITALAHLGRLEFDKIVPGHGAVGTKDLISAQRRYLMTLRRLVKHLAKGKVEAEEIVRKLGVPADYAKFGFGSWWPKNVRFVHQELMQGH